MLGNQPLPALHSVRSLPTSAEQEDHNANSMTAARHARQILENTAHVLSIELYTAARALVYACVTGQMPAWAREQTLYPQIKPGCTLPTRGCLVGPEIEQVHQMALRPCLWAETNRLKND